MSDEKNKLPSDAGRRRESIDTEGGAYIGGGVKTGGGDFTGRDRIVHGDVVSGDKVAGDKVGGDQIQAGDISGTGIAIGRGARASVTQGVSGNDVAALFAAIKQQIDARPEDPNVDKDELNELVQNIEQENAKGEQANPSKVERWLGYLASMADDIYAVTVEALKSPAAGISAVVRKIAAKARGETGAAPQD